MNAPTVQCADRGPAQARATLLAEVARMKDLLRAHLAGEYLQIPRTTCVADLIAERLGLSDFERDILLLTVAVELDSEVGELVGAAAGSVHPTFALALAALPDAHWDSLSPDRPLRRWLLVEPAGAGPLATRALLPDEHILHALTGVCTGADRLGGLVHNLDQPTALTPRQYAVAIELAQAAAAFDSPVLLRVQGDDQDAGLAVAGVVADRLGLRLLRVCDAALGDGDLIRVATVLDREALLFDRLLLTESERVIRLLTTPQVATTDAGIGGAGERTVLARTVGLPEPIEQAELWRATVQPAEGEVLDVMGDLAHHYRLPARGISAIAGEWAATTDRSGAELRRLTRERARVGLGGLAERIEVRAGWDDLVVPTVIKDLLRDLAGQVRHRVRVYDEWGFARKSNRGMGISALFAGESGTGKTMAAEVMAGELGLDLYRVELSAVVSKYIGETEKNLCRVFDAAESSGAILLFDEADAIFGRRTEVKDSHDRYANLEVAYLLQRMENYRGLAILTTNLRSNVDRAFLRRLRFVVQFPFPDHALRANIWRRAFPAQTPTEGLNVDALAQLQIAGGSIHAIAVSAAFSAAGSGTPVRPEHILRAAKVDYAKAERTLTESETRALIAVPT